MSLSQPIVTVLQAFESAFSQPTWSKVPVLIVGTLFAQGRRTVAAALRQTGLSEALHFSLYHHVLNRARWSALELSRRLLSLLVRTFVAVGGALTFGIDETLERRWGRRLNKRGHYRDPLASSQQHSVATGGVRWIVLTLVITPPWTPRSWALPVLSVPAPTPEVSQRLGLRHKTVPHRARQMILLMRRWLPAVEMTVLGDQTYSVHELGEACARWGVRLVAPLRMDAALYMAASPRRPGTKGRPRMKGKRLPKLAQVLKATQTSWQRVRWYNGRRRELDVTRGTAVWYRIGQPVLPSRWVLVRDPTGRMDPRAYFSTCPNDQPRALVQPFVNRWTIETTLEESRAHLGLETQRQWSDRAIERTTPCLLGLYSVVALLAHARHPDGKGPVQTTAWYAKSRATVADVLAAVRHHLWSDVNYSTSAHDPDLVGIPRSELSRLAQAVCYAY
jgi:DDE superfamily endonuclease